MTGSKRVVRRYYEDVLAGRRLDVLEQLVAPGFVGHDPAGATMDRAGYFDAVRMLHDAFGDLAVSIDDQVAEKDRVTTRWSAVGTHIGDVRGHRADRTRRSSSPGSTSTASTAIVSSSCGSSSTSRRSSRSCYERA